MIRRLILVSAMLLFANGAIAAGNFVQYKVGGESFEGYFISPADNAPLIVMVHDWDGLTEYEVKRADMLAELGYAVFAVDLFGEGIRPVETEEKKKLTGMLYEDRERMRGLLQGGLDKAAELGGNRDNAVAIGYCFGGAAILELARTGAALKGFVSFHGGLETPENQSYSQTKGKILVLHGSADTSVTLDQFAALAKELEEQDVDHEMITYGGAPHAFTVFDTERYREDADRKSWQRFTRFLADTL
ncbi:dienelactone hydrolase family protein [Desulfopila inferna]|uniref:dienelactone hydrolase family protein n=1 Tax=Desulfopila inferna TaxID=468528 RepID=UPI0019638E4A|nr:dienelactone hydrolase family protein [Desulfopila inferna]MBM9604043.1 dienelactone hydrolase family protein [Desulfopila inferna]